MNQEQAQQYLNALLERYKSDPESDSFSRAEKILLQQVTLKEENISKLLKQAKIVQDELEGKQRQLQMLDQQVVFERGQLSGVFDSLVALKPKD